MPGCAELACIYLAAGEGRRFGGRKLEAELHGKMLGLHAAETLAGMGFGRLVAVCNADQPRLNGKLAQLGFAIILNPDPAAGRSSSLSLGLSGCAGGKAKGALIALADMPFIGASHLEKLAQSFAAADYAEPVCSTNGTARMPPAIFPSAIWPGLARLSGDQGARSLLATAIAVLGDAAMLADIDRPDELPS